MNRFNIVAPLVLASVQLQRGGGLCSAQTSLQSDDHVFDWGDDDHVFDWDDDEPSGRQEDSENSNLINCDAGGHLIGPESDESKCDSVATVLNEKIKNETDGTILCGDDDMDWWDGRFRGPDDVGKCDEVANALSGQIGEADGTISCDVVVGGQDDGYHKLKVVNKDATKCNTVAEKLSSLVADDVETDAFKLFYYAAGPLTGVTFIGSGYYAYWYLDGDTSWRTLKCLLFALFVALRVFDLCSDWGMWAITLASQHTYTTLRTASFVVSIIGSLLTVVDLSVMLKRAKDSFGVKVLDSKSKKTVGCGMLAVMLLEDLPQMVITIAYFVEIGGNDVREVDPIAITSLALSGVFFFVNAFVVVKYICC